MSGLENGLLGRAFVDALYSAVVRVTFLQPPQDQSFGSESQNV